MHAVVHLADSGTCATIHAYETEAIRINGGIDKNSSNTKGSKRIDALTDSVHLVNEGERVVLMSKITQIVHW